MSNPLQNFSIAEESPTHFHLKHPNGHVLSLEKGKMSPEANNFVKKMCAGGGMAYGGFSDESVRKMADGGDPAGTNTVLASNDQTPAWTPPVDTQMPNPQSTSGDISPNRADQTNSAPMPNQQTNQTSQSNVPNSGQGTSAPMDPLAQSNLSQKDLLEKQGKNAEAYSKTLEDVGAAQQKAYQDQIDQTSKMKTPDQIMADYKAKDDQFMQNVMNSKVDPNRLWSNASTGQKIMASIGIMLSGMGAGANGQNMAAQTLNNAINRDIGQQQNEQSKQMNLWKMNREALGSDLQANLATRSQMLSMTQAKIAQSASTLTNSAAQQQAQNAIFQIEQEKINNRRAQMLLTPQGGGSQGQPGTLSSNPLDVVRMMVPAGQQDAVAKEVGRSMDIAKNKDSALQAFDEAARQTRLGSAKTGAEAKSALLNDIPGLGYTPQAINTLTTKMTPVIRDTEGRPNELLESHMKANFPAAMDSDERVAAKRQTISDMFDEEGSSPLFRKYTGIDLKNFASTADNPINRQPQQIQNYYAYSKAHPEQQVSQDFMTKHPEFFK